MKLAGAFSGSEKRKRGNWQGFLADGGSDEREIHIYILDTVCLSGYNIHITFEGTDMFEYMTAQEAAEKRDVSLRWVQKINLLMEEQ